MYIHEEIQKLVLPLIKKYDLELIDLIAEMNHACWEFYPLNENGIENLIKRLDEASIRDAMESHDEQ